MPCRTSKLTTKRAKKNDCLKDVPTILYSIENLLKAFLKAKLARKNVPSKENNRVK